MKNFLFCLLAVCFASCSISPQKKAQKIINHQLKLSLHDYDSYENVEFGKLDSTFSKVEDLPEYANVMNMVDDFLKQGKNKLEEAKMYSEFNLYDKQVEYARWGKALLDSATYYINIAKKMDSSFVPEFVGWEMTHTFRANNARGNKVIAHHKYFFDKEITQIVKEEDLDE